MRAKSYVFLGGKVELKFLRITMNITVINTKLLIVHVQKINTWTLKKMMV